MLTSITSKSTSKTTSQQIFWGNVDLIREIKILLQFEKIREIKILQIKKFLKSPELDLDQLDCECTSCRTWPWLLQRPNMNRNLLGPRSWKWIYMLAIFYVGQILLKKILNYFFKVARSSYNL